MTKILAIQGSDLKKVNIKIDVNLDKNVNKIANILGA